ncbi:sensor histidine kinase [Paenibacillus sp. MMS18-CY102]|uniref:sensor histidine kinase n=1 Tax=Paenibacillus sp. MMS18-CY102 TaxID=2682849 RepID=UPI0013667091|nr:histidine kinase [Paenibacillus sp. MMS18-CY102]MWC30232.1 HAMP domain-containing protein [Paenibacillus sp. MMS18-CY102]
MSLSNQIDTNLQQISHSSKVLMEDPSIREFTGYSFNPEPYETAYRRKLIFERIQLFGLSTALAPRVSVFSNSNQAVISTEATRSFDPRILYLNAAPKWQSETVTNNKSMFYFYSMKPENKSMNQPSNIVIEVKFSSEELKKWLDKSKLEAVDDPFLYRAGAPIIANHSAKLDIITRLIPKINFPSEFENTEPTVQNVRIAHQQYEIYIKKLTQADWYVIDYIPVEEIVKPITANIKLFYVTIGLIICVGILLVYLLYRYVQRPISQLVVSLKKLQVGDYSVRIHAKPKSEFLYLFEKFNGLAAQIQELIEKVFKEKLQSRDAKLKHLQSQINPHFLYNSMGYIINMTKLDNKGAVISMAKNLSEFYRYTTRLENPLARMAEEVQLVTNYLEIQKLRMERVQYEIDLPDGMLEQFVPRLLLQPMIENAFEHGFQQKLRSGLIRIHGLINAEEYCIMIDDDGAGIPEEKYDEINQTLNNPIEENVGCGLWNVNQRIKMHYGEGSGLELGPSPLGGVRVTILWKLTSNDRGA